MASESDVSEKMDEVKITEAAGDMRFRFVFFSSESIIKATYLKLFILS